MTIAPSLPTSVEKCQSGQAGGALDSRGPQCAGRCTLDSLVKRDLAAKRLGPRTRLALAMITRLACTVFFGLATAALLVYAQAIREAHEATVDLLIPRYPFVWAGAAGCAVLAIVLVIKCLTDIAEFRKTWNP